MRRAALVYNPRSGSSRGNRIGDVKAVQSVLEAAGVEALLITTCSALDATEQTRRAISEGFDTIFACGGDGTINDVLQGIVGSRTALGVIPLGTANALARDLGIPFSPKSAAHCALNAEARRIAVGQVLYRDFSGSPALRYFCVTAGVGMDAHLFYKLNMLSKGRLGIWAYYVKALHLWVTQPMKFFDVDFLTLEGQTRRESVSELLAVRITNFGGLLRKLAPGASLARNDMRLVLFKTSRRWSYMRYILRGMFGANWKVRGIELESVEKVTCKISGTEQKIHVEADGELLGTLPAEISIVPDALTILAPKGNHSSLC
ncbi:MAG TPA: diacylglycerol kinase family protein [Terriglobales bacterium]|nr:diacylglycerol kinase family protein [Terriglobales bacterium]